MKIATMRAAQAMKHRAELAPDLFKKSAEKGLYLREDYEASYTRCLKERGIEK